jgi:hypothetical protein
LGAAFAGDGFVFGGESLRVLFESLDAEELRVERLLVVVALWFVEQRQNRINHRHRAAGCQLPGDPLRGKMQNSIFHWSFVISRLSLVSSRKCECNEK